MYYTQNHLLGGFINDHYKSGKTQNVSGVDIEGTAHHPYSRGMSSRVTSHTLYCATEDLAPDTELLTSYYGLFRIIHINCEDPVTASNRHKEDIIAKEVLEEAERGVGERMTQTMVQTDMQVNCRWEEQDSSVTMQPARMAQVRSKPIEKTVVHKVDVNRGTKKLRKQLGAHVQRVAMARFACKRWRKSSNAIKQQQMHSQQQQRYSKTQS